MVIQRGWIVVVHFVGFTYLASSFTWHFPVGRWSQAWHGMIWAWKNTGTTILASLYKIHINNSKLRPNEWAHCIRHPGAGKAT
jgi:hypothetical protein